MNSRIIKAYIEMTKSQTKHTPYVPSAHNPKIVSHKVKRDVTNKPYATNVDNLSLNRS